MGIFLLGFIPCFWPEVTLNSVFPSSLVTFVTNESFVVEKWRTSPLFSVIWRSLMGRCAQNVLLHRYRGNENVHHSSYSCGLRYLDVAGVIPRQSGYIKVTGPRKEKQTVGSGARQEALRACSVPGPVLGAVPRGLIFTVEIRKPSFKS